MKKKLLTIIIIIMVGLIAVGIFQKSRGALEYTKQAETKIIAGDIYMRDKGSEATKGTIKSMNSEEGKEKGKKYNFSIEGYNTSEKDIYYGIYLNYGEELEGKERFRDEDIMIYLTETKEGEKKEVFGPGRLVDFNNELIYASTVEGGIEKENKIEIEYELTVWLREDIQVKEGEVSETEEGVYGIEDYKNRYVTIDINVEGNFIEKETVNGQTTIEGIEVETNKSYDLKEAPESKSDIKITISTNKEPEKIIINNLTKNEREERVATKEGDKWQVEIIAIESAKYNYYVEYKDKKISPRYNFEVKINSKRHLYTEKPTEELCKNIEYNGEEQELIENNHEGYILENYKQTNAGSYKIKAKVKEEYRWNDKTIYDVEINCEIKKKPLTITAEEQIITYGENISKELNQITTDNLLNGDNVTSITLTPSTSDVTTDGTITPSEAVIKDKNEETVTDNYDIKYVSGSLTINQATPNVTLEPESGNVYVGEDVTFKVTSTTEGVFNVTSTSESNATASVDGTLGTEKTVTVHGAAKGSAIIKVTFIPSNKNYKEVTKEYNITVNNKIASMGECKDITYTGESQSLISEGVGVTYDITSGIDAKNYEITGTLKTGYEFPEETITKKTCTIKKKDITITAKDQTINYKETISKTPNDVIVELAANHVLSSITLIESTSSVTTSGTITPSGAVIKDENAKEVTSNYNITYNPGNLTIKALPAVMGTCYSRTYTGSSQTLISAGTGVTYTTSSSGATASGTSVTARNAGSYIIKATPQTGYEFASGATTQRTCTINKASVTLNLSSTVGEALEWQPYTIRASVKPSISGTYTATPASSSMTKTYVNGNLIEVRGIQDGPTSVTVRFTPSDTSNYNTPSSKIYRATIIDSEVRDTKGNVASRGRYFNGTSNWAGLGNANHNFANHASIVIRFKVHKTGSRQSMIGNWDAGGFGLSIVSQKIYYEAHIGGAYRSFYSSFELELDKWYTVVATYDGSQMKLYVDGKLDGYLDYSGNIKKSPVAFALAVNLNESGTRGEYANITASDAYVYDRVITASEVDRYFSGVIYDYPSDDLLTYKDYTNIYNNATYNPTVTENGDIEFDGSDDYLNIGYKSYDFGNTVSLVGRAKFPKLTGTAYFILNNTTSNFDKGVTIITRKTNEIAFFCNAKNTSVPTDNYTIDTWYTIVGTYDGQVAKLYINGVLVNSINLTESISVTSSPFSIGTKAASNDFKSKFTISDAMIYTDALTASEVSTYFRGDITNYPTDNLLARYNGLYTNSSTIANNILKAKIGVTRGLII